MSHYEKVTIISGWGYGNMEKIKAFLATAKQFLFDKTITNPETAGKIDAEIDIDICEGIFRVRSTNEIELQTSEKAIRKWLQRKMRSHNGTIKEYINK